MCLVWYVGSNSSSGVGVLGLGIYRIIKVFGVWGIGVVVVVVVLVFKV